MSCISSRELQPARVKARSETSPRVSEWRRSPETPVHPPGKDSYIECGSRRICAMITFDLFRLIILTRIIDPSHHLNMGILISESDFLPPDHQRAIVADDSGTFIVWDEAPCPPMLQDQICIKTEAIAINPSDTKMVGDFQSPYSILGTDYAGTVIAIGSKIKGVAVGDRVCGASHGMSELRPDRGAFGQYNVTIGNVWLKIPDSMSTVAGASLCAGLCTAGLAIRSLGLPMPGSPAERPLKVLVYGGSTATGTLAIQLLKLFDAPPILPVCSTVTDISQCRASAHCYLFAEQF